MSGDSKPFDSYISKVVDPVREKNEKVLKNEADKYKINKQNNLIRLENVINISVSFLIVIFTFVTAIVIIARGIHLIIGDCGWMKEDDIKTVDYIISAFFFGQGGAYVFTKAKEQFSSGKEQNSKGDIEYPA